MNAAAIRTWPHGKGPVRTRDERGFTLIEVLLSLSILVVMIGLVLSALRLGQRSMEKGEKAMDEAAVRRFVVKRLSSDVASMLLYADTGPGGGNNYLFNGQEGRLAFVTAYHAGSTGMPWGGASYVIYSLGDEGLTLTEKALPFAVVEAKQEGRTFGLGPSISGVRFSYLGPRGWRTRWDAKVRKRLPLAVRAEFSFRDGAPLVVTVPVWASYAPEDTTPQGPGGAEDNAGKT